MVAELPVGLGLPVAVALQVGRLASVGVRVRARLGRPLARGK